MTIQPLGTLTRESFGPNGDRYMVADGTGGSCGVIWTKPNGRVDLATVVFPDESFTLTDYYDSVDEARDKIVDYYGCL